VNEAEFWVALEYRVCRELAGLADNSIRGLWCDGFVAKRYYFGDSEPRISGKAWICSGQKQYIWEFTFFLPNPVASYDEIDWAALLPPENVTRWLSLDSHSERIQIAPGAAVPDSA
jgi:hypothetical protein